MKLLVGMEPEGVSGIMVRRKQGQKMQKYIGVILAFICGRKIMMVLLTTVMPIRIVNHFIAEIILFILP